MDFFETLIERNAHFAQTDFSPDLKMLPTTGTIIVGCVDPRVDPAAILELKQGEAVVIRNIGGRINKSLLEALAVLRTVAKAAGQDGGVRNLVLLHHTDCGIIGCYHYAPDLLAQHLGVETTALEDMAITDPYGSVVQDVAAIKANEQLPAGLVVSGIVYDVKTGQVANVVPPAPLRVENASRRSSAAT